jgi:Domain of unknown function (DUF4375)
VPWARRLNEKDRSVRSLCGNMNPIIARTDKAAMLSLFRHPFFPLKTLALVLAIALFATAVHAAPQDGTAAEPQKAPKSVLDLQIPIPYEPDVASNGCRLRQSPSEPETGALNEVPFWSLLEDINITYTSKLIIGGREKLLAAVPPLDEEARTLALLYVLWHKLGHDDALHTFFFLDEHAIAPLMRDTLQKAGMTRELEVFSRAMALFGNDYPPDREQRHKLFGWSRPHTWIDAVTTRPAPLNAFDYKLLALESEFGTKATFRKTILAYVEARPALWHRIEAKRVHLNEPDRMTVLTNLLRGRVGDLWRPYAEVEWRLASLSKEQRTLAVMAAFNDQFRNGGVHQFFYNSEGMLAPNVHEAMIELGLTEQAAIFKRGLDMLGKPYVRDTNRRRHVYFKRGWSNRDEKLSALTDELYALNGGLSFHRIRGSTIVEGGPGIDFAMLKYARQHRLLPC